MKSQNTVTGLLVGTSKVKGILWDNENDEFIFDTKKELETVVTVNLRKTSTGNVHLVLFKNLVL